MIVSIFGGGTSEYSSKLWKVMYSEIELSKKKQILIIPFAITTESRKKYYFEYFSNKNIEVLDASNTDDLNKINDPILIICGGIDKKNLNNNIRNNKTLLEVIYKATHILAESGGAMLLGSVSRIDRPYMGYTEGLGMFKDTIIEPHYYEQNRHKLLIAEMKDTGVGLGIGIDSNSGLRIDTTKPYIQGIPLGNGKYEYIKADILKNSHR